MVRRLAPAYIRLCNQNNCQTTDSIAKAKFLHLRGTGQSSMRDMFAPMKLDDQQRYIRCTFRTCGNKRQHNSVSE